MVVWKEVGGGFIQEGGGKGEVSCQVSIHRAGRLGTGDTMTVGGVVESDTCDLGHGAQAWDGWQARGKATADLREGSGAKQVEHLARASTEP